MLLWMSSGELRGSVAEGSAEDGGDGSVDTDGGVALEAADHLSAGASLVGGCQRSRQMTMLSSAQFAWRLQPRLRRWRCWRPEDASIGEVPQRAATEEAERSRSGLSPAAASKAAAF